MFMGEFTHSMDTKNRIIVPSKFREELGNPFVVTKGLDGCLYCYPMAEWDKLNEKMERLPDNKKEHRQYIRYFTTSASMVDIDKQGRALIPANLVRHGDLKEEIVVTGVREKLEIWAKERWEEYNDENIDIEAIAENIDLSIY